MKEIDVFKINDDDDEMIKLIIVDLLFIQPDLFSRLLNY